MVVPRVGFWHQHKVHIAGDIAIQEYNTLLFYEKNRHRKYYVLSLDLNSIILEIHGKTKGIITHINSHIAQLRPAHGMVQIVLAEVVFRQVGDVRQLHVGDVFWSQHANIHCV